MHWLVRQLADRCIAEGLRCEDDEMDFERRLADAEEIIDSAWSATAPEYAKYWREEKEEPTEREKEKIKKARKTLWVRHDPKRAFDEGWRSEHYASFDGILGFNEEIASYLDRPYLRHPWLDWIFLDMTISGRLCDFGEDLKLLHWLGKRISTRSRLLGAQGNLAEMKKIHDELFFKRCGLWIWWTLAVPIGAIWAAFHWSFEATAWWLVGIYGTLVGGFILVKLLLLIMRLIDRLTGKIAPLTKAFQLWDCMYEVWLRLEGPVVNPTLVRKAMVKSTNEGAFWKAVSWSLIDRVVADDPAVWVVQSTRN
jgi:hypothetical protein